MTGLVRAMLRIMEGGIVSPPDGTVYVEPNAPTNLAQGVTKSPTTMQLTWTAATSNDGFPIIGYRIRQDGVLIASIGNVTTYTATGLTANTPYNFAVASYTEGAVSAYTADLQLTTEATGTEPGVDTTPPTTPATVTATALSGTQARIDWTAATDADSGVMVHILTKDGRYVDYIEPPTVTATVSGLVAGQTYTFGVYAIDNAGNIGAARNATALTMPGTPPTPIPPRSLSGAIVTRAARPDADFTNQDPPVIPARTLAAATTTAPAVVAGGLANQPPGATDLPPVWVLPADDDSTVYAVAEGDTVDVLLSANDPEGNAVTIEHATGTLPAGLAYDPATKRVTGTVATGAGSVGGLNYDSFYLASDETAVAPLTITTANLPNGTTGQPYSYAITTTGGTPPLFFVCSGLPATMTMNLAGVITGQVDTPFTGSVTVTAADSAGNQAVKTFTLVIGAAPSGDFASRAQTDGTLFATDFHDVYLGSGTGPAALNPARVITSTAILTSAPYVGSHVYSTAEGLYGQGGAGPYPEGTPRAVLDSTTFGFNTLRLPGRANDGRQGGNLIVPIDGMDNTTVYPRFYVQFRVRFDREAIAWAWSSPTYDHKVFMIGSNQGGEVIIASVKNAAAIMMYYDVSKTIGNVPGTKIAGANNPYRQDVYRYYNIIDRGDTTLTNATTEDEKAKWLRNYGPLYRGYDWQGYGYDAAYPYLDERTPAQFMPRGWPDSAAFDNLPCWQYDQWITVQVFVEHFSSTGMISLEYWAAYDNQPFTKLFSSIANIPSGSLGDTSRWPRLEILEYSTDRVRNTATDRNTWFRELQTSLKPIPGPGGFMPPDNQG